ncbi:MAG: DUF2474 family protein [Oricola sp.]|nr:DUF2474 family protein [Oricola sp.]
MQTEDASRWKRIGWFIPLWIAGVATVSAIAFCLKLVMKGLEAS